MTFNRFKMALVPSSPPLPLEHAHTLARKGGEEELNGANREWQVFHAVMVKRESHSTHTAAHTRELKRTQTNKGKQTHAQWISAETCPHTRMDAVELELLTPAVWFLFSGETRARTHTHTHTHTHNLEVRQQNTLFIDRWCSSPGCSTLLRAHTHARASQDVGFHLVLRFQNESFFSFLFWFSFSAGVCPCLCLPDDIRERLQPLSDPQWVERMNRWMDVGVFAYFFSQTVKIDCDSVCCNDSSNFQCSAFCLWSKSGVSFWLNCKVHLRDMFHSLRLFCTRFPHPLT